MGCVTTTTESCTGCILNTRPVFDMPDLEPSLPGDEHMIQVPITNFDVSIIQVVEPSILFVSR